MQKTFQILIKHKAYLLFLLILVLYLFNANRIVATISNGEFQLKRVDSKTVMPHDPVYFGLDNVNIQNDFTERVYISGWAFCETEQDNSKKDRGLILRAGNYIYKIGGSDTARSDILETFESKYSISGTRHGFTTVFSTVALKEGIYKLYVYDQENDVNYGTIFTGIQFIKDKNGFRRLENIPIENFPAAQSSDKIKFALDTITVVNEEIKLSGWGILSGANSSISEVFIEITDTNGSVYVYQVSQTVRKDIQKAFKSDDYLMSGIRATLNISQIDDGLLELHLIVSNNGVFKSIGVKRYQYDSIDNTLTLIEE